MCATKETKSHRRIDRQSSLTGSFIRPALTARRYLLVIATVSAKDISAVSPLYLRCLLQVVAESESTSVVAIFEKHFINKLYSSFAVDSAASEKLDH